MWCNAAIESDDPSFGAFNILNMSRLPLIGIPADRRLCGKHPFHMVGEKYIEAIAMARGRCRCWCRALGTAARLVSLLEACDGLLFTGSPSNVEPHHYGGPASAPGTLHDPNRDATTLPLIPRAVAAGVPVLAICRGFQEMNVAYGGTLHQRLHEVDGICDHREDESPAARGAIRARARGRAGTRRDCCGSLAGARASRSTRCIGRASRRSAPDSRSRRVRRTG